MRALLAGVLVVPAVIALFVASSIPRFGQETAPGLPPATPEVAATEAPAAGTPAPVAVTAEPPPVAPPPPPSAAIAGSAARIFSATRDLVGTLADDRTTYAAALNARDAGLLDFATAGFRLVIQRDGVLAPIAQLRLAQALAAHGKTETAAAAFDHALTYTDFPASLRRVAIFEAAGVRLDLAQRDRALDLLALIASDANAPASDRASALWEIARIRRGMDDPRWVDDAVAVLSVAPSSGAAVRALDTLEAAGEPFPLLSAALVRYRARHNAAARTLYQAVLARSPSADEAHVAWFYLGALAERFGDELGAIDAYGRSIDYAPGGWLAHHSRYWRGRIYQDRGEMTAAVREYDRLVADYPDSSFVTDAELRAAVALGLGGSPGAALDRLEAIAAQRGGTPAANAARWHTVFRTLYAINAAPLDPRDYSTTALSALIDADSMQPLPAAHFLERPVPPDDHALVDGWMVATFGARVPMPLGRAALEHPALLIGVELAAVGEGGVARALIRGLPAEYRGRPYELLDLSRAAAEVGLYDASMIAALNLIAPLSTAQRLAAPRSILALVYPAPYASELDQAMLEWQLPSLLILALVRQESAFDPTAGSHAGALGLTQVIEPTGRAIAQSLGRPWDVQDLYDPTMSLRYGAYYLYVQLAQFDGNVFAALAAYNAGPGSAARWLRNQPFPGPDGYLQAVDFAETRLYLDKVLENYAWYRYVYAGAPAPSIR